MRILRLLGMVGFSGKKSGRKSAKIPAKIICLLLAAVLALGCLAACGKDDSSTPPPDVPWLPDDLTDEDSAAPVAPDSSAPEAPPVEETSVPEPEPESSEPEKQPAPTFIENTPAVSRSGKTVTVSLKTDAPSTVNAILTTNGSGISTAAFYDYYNRNQALDGAVAKTRSYEVSSAGGSISFDLPDFAKAYYVLLNAAENATGTWQSGVTLVTVFEPSANAPTYTNTINQLNSTEEHLVFAVETSVPVTAFCLVCPSSSAAPTAKQVQAGGGDFKGSVAVVAKAASNTDKAPYVAQVLIPKKDLAAGGYTAWFTAQSTQFPDAPISELGKFVFTM